MLMMSGGIFPTCESLWVSDYASCHPLVCHLCHGQYRQPCLLDCYHIFCASCLRGRAFDSCLSCPLCGYPTVVKGINALPPEDRLLKFLVDNSSDSLETVQCANCDMESNIQDAGAMCYCNTCGQPLCAECREITHKAKMFSQHEIVSLAKRTKQGHRKCSLHDEHYIMFSTEKKSMLCINCFRDMQVESRTHCIDIETAYAQGCEILDQAVMAVKELQTSAREAIVLLKAMIVEVRCNVEEEESAICCLFKSMQEKLAERKEILLRAAQSQHEEKERAMKEQLSHLAAFLPTLQVHLVACSAFLSSANKFEFLDMGYQLMDRLCKIAKLPHRLRPTQSSKINTDYHAEFARSPGAPAAVGSEKTTIHHRRVQHQQLQCCPEIRELRGVRGRLEVLQGSDYLAAVHALVFIWKTRIVSFTRSRCSRLPSPMSMSCGSPSLSEMPLGSSGGRRPTSHRYISTKVLLAEGGDTPFTEHCRNYENSYRTLQAEMQRLKDQVQAMHRDLTKHHSLINTNSIEEILEKSLHVDNQITSQYSAVQTMRALFEEIWEETFQRVTNEQEIYEAQLHDLLQLKQENCYLTTIARQIGPYILSIAKVKERLEPRYQEPNDVEDDRTETMLKIYEDSTTSSDSKHCNSEIQLSEYKWDPNTEKRPLILPPEKLKMSDYNWPGKQRSQEKTSHKDIQV